MSAWRGFRPGPVAGEIRAPASKSLANRALILAAQARSPSRLDGVPAADDTRRLLAAFAQIGIAYSRPDEQLVELSPSSTVVPAASVTIDAGGGGTTARFLLALLATRPGRYRLDGIARLRERPLAPLIDALRQLGATIRCLDGEGQLPVEIEGRPLGGGRVTIDASRSSQFATALLLIAPSLASDLELELVGEAVSESYLDLTLGELQAFGVAARRQGRLLLVPRTTLDGCQRQLEADWSGATYLAAAGALAGGPVRIRGLAADSRQGDRVIVDWLRSMGASVVLGRDQVEVCGGALNGIEVDARQAPDAVPTLAAVATFANGRTTIRGAAHLRAKESDRIEAVVEAVRTLGATSEPGPDGLVIDGDPSLRRKTTLARIETRADHRLAMAFALAGLVREGVVVRDPACVDKSYPDFWRDLVTLGATIAESA